MEKEKLNIEEIIPSAAGKPEVIELLNFLFNKPVEKDNSIANEVFFDRYFSLALLPDELGEEEFTDAFVDPGKAGTELVALNQKNSRLLLIKLNHRYGNYVSRDAEEFTALMESFFELYQSVSTSDYSGNWSGGLNADNLRLLIIKVYRTSSIPKDIKEKLFEQLLLKERNSYRFLSFFLGMDAIGLFADDLDERKLLFNRLKDFQWKYLRRSIAAENVPDTIAIMQQARTFITQVTPGEFTQADVAWFKQHILEDNKEFISKNLDSILEHVKSFALKDYKENNVLARQLIESIFHDPSNLELFNEPEVSEAAENILDYYNDFETHSEHFIFTAQKPVTAGDSDHNDHFYAANDDQRVFDFNNLSAIKIILDPLETKYWRLGFRFFKKMNLSSGVPPRHSLSHPYVVIAAGGPVEKTTGDWHEANKLSLTNYFSELGTEKDKDSFFVIDEQYSGQKISVELSYSSASFIIVKIKTGQTNEQIGIFENVRGFKYCSLSAWCDSRDFKMEATIKVKGIDSLAPSP